MTDENVSKFIADHDRQKGLRDAAAELLAGATALNVEQAHEIAIRDVDANEQEPRVLRLIPLGPVIGVAITAHDQLAIDDDILYISRIALGSVFAALGFTLPSIHTCERRT